MRSNFPPTSRYTFIEPVSSPRSSFGRVFVYAFTLPEHVSHGNIIPFHIGSTNNLPKRLANHKELNWYENRYNHPLRVLILGTVETETVNTAIFNLTEALTKQGYLLTQQNRVNVKQLTDMQLSAYSKRLTNFMDTVEQWGDNWDLKTRAAKQQKLPEFTMNLPEPANPSSPLFLPPTALEDRTTPLTVTKQLLVNQLETINFATQQETNLNHKIVSSYENYNGYSQITLTKADVEILGTKKLKLNKYWFTKNRTVPGATVYFYPQKSFIKKIIQTT